MNASEARKIVMNLSKDRLDYIYGKINNAIICGWGNVYIDNFNITISEKEKLVISLYYYEELTLKEISYIMKLSEARISQIHTKAVFTIRGKLLNLLDKQ